MSSKGTNKSVVVNEIVLSALFIAIFMFPGLLYSLKFFASQYPLDNYNQYNYRYNYAYSNYGYAYGAYNYRPYGPYLMPSTNCNAIYGCTSSYNSQIYIRNALDYTYYTRPELLAPRYMNNHMRYVRGVGLQNYYYPTYSY